MEQTGGMLVRSISYNMLLQLSFRIVSFVLNSLLIRYVNTELIGTCNFRLQLLHSTIVFLAREPFKRAFPNIKLLLSRNEKLLNKSKTPSVNADDDENDKLKRQRESNVSSFRLFINSVWLTLPNGVLLSIIFGYIWMFVLEKPDETLVANYELSVVFCCMSCCLELCAEPFNAAANLYYLAKQKVIAEAISLFFYNTSFVALAIFVPSLGSMSFSIGCMIYSTIFVFTTARLVIKNVNLNEANKPILKQLVHSSQLTIKHFFPISDSSLKQSSSSSSSTINLAAKWFDIEYLKYVKSFYFQSIFKQLLTEGERYLITLFNLLTISESGVYDIINNLGSLIARFIFLPIEDQSYIYFTNSFKRGYTYKKQEEEASETNAKKDLENPSNLNKTTTTTNNSKRIFENLLKTVSLVGILVLVFGQSYAQLGLQIYGGDKLGKNFLYINMLRFHCVYLFLLAVNGVTESFYNATMSESQLNSHNYRLIKFSVIYLVNVLLLAKWLHIYGFVIANCLNMMLRIYYSIKHILKVFQGYKYLNDSYRSSGSADDVHDANDSYDIQKILLPQNFVLFTLILSLLLTKFSENIYWHNTVSLDGFINQYTILHLIIGAFSGCLTLLVIYKKENQLSIFIKNFIKDRNKKI